jgi:hypothetical protein
MVLSLAWTFDALHLSVAPSSSALTSPQQQRNDGVLDPVQNGQIVLKLSNRMVTQIVCAEEPDEKPHERRHREHSDGVLLVSVSRDRGDGGCSSGCVRKNDLASLVPANSSALDPLCAY